MPIAPSAVPATEIACPVPAALAPPDQTGVAGVIRPLRRPARLGAPVEPVPANHRELRVASYNVHKCVGTDGRFDPARIAAVVGELGADLVALQEVDRRFGRRTGLLDALAIERATGLVPLPVSDLPDGMGWHGNALLVRPGTRWTLQRLHLPGAEPRGAVVAELDLVGGGALRVVAAHFGLLRRCRTRQAAAVLGAVARGPAMPTLMLGDLNEWRPVSARSPFRLLEPLFGPVVPGPPSFPSRMPLLALDQIFGCPRARVRALQAHDTPLARVASDHLPLKARVRLSIDAEAAAPAPMVEAA